MNIDTVRKVREYLKTWTQQDIDRLQQGASHGNEEHLRFATIMLWHSSRKLEKLTWTLVVLSMILAFLTAVLIWRTYVT